MSEPTTTTPPIETKLAERPAMAFVPKNVDEAYRMAEMLGKSGLLPDVLKGKPFDVLVILLTGAEFGISPMAALREVYVVKGKGYISSLMKVGLIKQSPLCEYFRLVESTAKKATYATKRRGEEEVRMSFTIEEAIQAGLATGRPGGQDNWSKYPTLMLRRRCEGQLADTVYPDVTRGLGSSDDEMVEAERTFEGTTAPMAANTVQVKVNRPPPSPPPVEAEPSGPKPSPPPPSPPQAGEPAPVTDADAAIEAELDAAWAAATTADQVMATIPLMKKLSPARKEARRPAYNARLAAAKAGATNG